MNHNYSSYFSEYIQGMLAARTVLGYAEEPYAGALQNFDQYCLAFHPDCKELTEHLAMSWVLGDNGGTKGVQGRARATRLLAQYMNLSGREAYVLPERYFSNPKPKEVYMFTDDELSRLFSAIDALPESGRVPYSQHMLPVMFRLIYTCGLRPQEGNCTGGISISRRVRYSLRIPKRKKSGLSSCLVICLHSASVTIRCASFSMKITFIFSRDLWTAR